MVKKINVSKVRKIFSPVKLLMIKSPKTFAKPQLNKILPRAKPLPKSNKDGQSIWLIAFDFKILSFEFRGKIKRRLAKKIPTIPEFNEFRTTLSVVKLSGIRAFINPGKNQKKIVVRNRIMIVLSSPEKGASFL